MKLVTFEDGQRAHRAGALVDDGTRIVDLALACLARGWEVDADRSFRSVQAMIEGGEQPLAQAYDLVRAPAAGTTVPVTGTVLHAPLQPPPQMRDCLCFEGHLIQAFQNLRTMRAQQSSDPAAKMAEMQRDGVLAVPKTFYEQPIYYKANRFAVMGTGHDVVWPSYSEFMDFELEFGIYTPST